MTFKEAVDHYIAALLRGTIMTGDEREANVSALVEAWVILKYTSDRIDKRLKAIRAVLLDKAEEYGKSTEKGGSKLLVEGSTVLRERRVASLPDEKKVRAMLEEHGVKPDQVFSKVTKVVLDASKIENLVALGKLPGDDIEAAKKVTWALRVKESHELADTLEAVVGEPGEELAEKAPRSKRGKASGSRKKGA